VDTHQSAWGQAVAGSIINELTKRRMEGSYAPSA
jgi:hypothetical protein